RYLPWCPSGVPHTWHARRRVLRRPFRLPATSIGPAKAFVRGRSWGPLLDAQGVEDRGAQCAARGEVSAEESRGDGQQHTHRGHRQIEVGLKNEPEEDSDVEPDPQEGAADAHEYAEERACQSDYRSFESNGSGDPPLVGTDGAQDADFGAAFADL